MKTLSIIIPTYNVEKYIERCLRSILLEKILDDIEVIIVNDGSKDNSLKIARDYEEKYKNSIIIIDKENGGHGSTINEGIKVATGKYTKVIDSDDWVNVDDFEQFVKRLKELDCDLVVSNYTRELVFSEEIIKFRYSNNVEYNKIYEFDKFDFKKLGLDYFFMSTSTFKTEVLKKTNQTLDEKTFYVDMEFVLFPIPNINTFIFLDYDIYRYFIGRKSQSVNMDSLVKNRSHHEKVLKRLIDYYNSLELSETRKKYLQNILAQMLNTHYIIYCHYAKGKECRKEIREFDKFLKEHDEALYNNIKNYAYIRWNRRTNFNYSSTKRHLFT